VYFCVYDTSVEQQRYLSALKGEQAAFERLIAEKAHLAPAQLGAGGEATSGTAAAMAAAAIPVKKGAVDGWGIAVEERSGSAAAAAAGAGRSAGATSASASAASSSIAPYLQQIRPLTVDIDCPDKHRRLVVVDLREFRARLPVALYKAGLELAHATLTVGDFILSPDMCVERKSVPDLFGSFASGRLYTQAGAITRYYKRPVLAIEFEEGRPFTLQLGEHMPPEIDTANPVSKMVLLTLHFPTLRILWCRSTGATATYFAALKQSQPEPDPAHAARIGTEEGDNAAAASATSSTALAAAPTNMAGIEVLRRLPGITAHNYAKLAARAGTLAGLAAMTRGQLSEVLGEGTAAILHAFLHARNAASL
jgi:DNA excision repair protein ERCC-4